MQAHTLSHMRTHTHTYTPQVRPVPEGARALPEGQWVAALGCPGPGSVPTVVSRLVTDPPGPQGTSLSEPRGVLTGVPAPRPAPALD